MKEYIGDSVYAEWNKFQQVELTTENGYGPTNTIILEPEVMRALVAFWTKVHGNPPVAERLGDEADCGPPDACCECEEIAAGYSEGTPYCAKHYRSRPSVIEARRKAGEELADTRIGPEESEKINEAMILDDIERGEG